MQLSSKERAFLKKLAHNLDPIVRIGKDGIDENVLKSISDVINKRELIKVKILQNSTVEVERELGTEIANKTQSVFVDSIGKILILFKPSKAKDAKITKERKIMSGGIVFGNRLLDVALISCFAAQFYKVFSPLFRGKKIQWIRLLETGGMPSSHASTVVSLVTGVFILKGASSIEFAISMVFASIVLYDATGVRRQAGKHAKALNMLIESIERRDGIEIINEQFKEFLGHTPIEVLVGSILGIIIGLLFKGYILG